jgi:hypothetical protein
VVGHDFRRKQDPNYWVKRLDKKLQEHAPSVALITDVRFRNEVDYIKSRGGFVVECMRAGEPDVAVHGHSSESELDSFKEWDFYITAETAEACREQARDIYRRLIFESSTAHQQVR